MPSCEAALQADAWFLGSRLDLQASALRALPLLGRGPSIYELGPGQFLAAFRYGAVVFFGAPEALQVEWIERLRPQVREPLGEPERDEIEIRQDSPPSEGVDPNGVVLLHDLSLPRLQTVAHVLAKSTVLAHYEERVAGELEAVTARIHGRALPARRQSRELLEHIGETFSIQAETVGRVETTEKPEILWDAPELDRLYEVLSIEFELRERDAALARKLRLIADSASTALDLIHTRQGLRVEWYIVILIAVEIVLIVYDIARA